MRRVLILIFIIALFSSCKKPSQKAAGVYHGTATYPTMVITTLHVTSSPDTITVSTIDNDNISIGNSEFTYSGESNGSYTFQCSDAAGYHSCLVKFDKTFSNMEYHTTGPGQVAYFDFTGSR